MTIRSYDVIKPDTELALRRLYKEAIGDSIETPSEASAVLLRLLVAPSFDGDELAARRRRRGGDVGATALQVVMKLDVIGFDKSPIRATGDVTVGADENSDQGSVRGWGRIEEGDNGELKLLVNEELANPGEQDGTSTHSDMDFNF